MSMETALLATLLLPLVGMVLIWLTGNSPNLRETVTLVTAVSLFAIVLALLDAVMAGEAPGLTLLEVMPGLELAFKIEPLGMLFACIASGLWIINSLYSIGYMRGNDEKKQTRFYMCFHPGHLQRHGHRFCREHVHALHLLRSADPLDLPAGRPQGD